jgi:circadian clock protein KaiC
MKKGVPKNHLILVSGHAGSGKSTLSMQFLLEGIKQFNEKGLYISFEQNKEDLIESAKSLGWKLKKLEKEGKLKIISFDPNKGNILDINKQIESSIDEFKPSRLVFDSLSTYAVYAETVSFFDLLMTYGLKKEELHLTPPPQSVTRRAITELLGKIKSYGILSFVISELPENSEFLSRDGISEFFCDGVILLTYTTVAGEAFGNLQVRKMRNTDHAHELHPTKIGKGGITISEESVELIR